MAKSKVSAFRLHTRCCLMRLIKIKTSLIVKFFCLDGTRGIYIAAVMGSLETYYLIISVTFEIEKPD